VINQINFDEGEFQNTSLSGRGFLVVDDDFSNYTTKILDAGNGNAWKYIYINKTGDSVNIYINRSDDNSSWSGFDLLKEDVGNFKMINIPKNLQTRYAKFRFILNGTATIQDINVRYDLADDPYIHYMGRMSLLEFGNGTTWIPNGFNVYKAVSIINHSYQSYVTTLGIFPEEMDGWTTELKDNNINNIRIWLTSEREWGDWWEIPFEYPLGAYNKTIIDRVDQLLSYCEQKGIKLQIVFFVQGELNHWDLNPYNISNGGIISNPNEWWTNKTCKEYQKQRIKYIIDRWGNSSAIWSWCLFGEYDIAPGNDTIWADWHEDMTDYIHSIDPHVRPVITQAAKGTLADKSPFKHVDITGVSDYWSYQEWPDPTNSLRYQIRLLQVTFNKPTFVAEFGHDDAENQGIGNQERYPYEFSHEHVWNSLIASGITSMKNSCTNLSEWGDSRDWKRTLYHKLGNFIKYVNWTNGEIIPFESNISTIDGILTSKTATCLGNNRVILFLKGNATKLNIVGLEGTTFNVIIFDYFTGKIISATMQPMPIQITYNNSIAVAYIESIQLTLPTPTPTPSPMPTLMPTPTPTPTLTPTPSSIPTAFGQFSGVESSGSGKSGSDRSGAASGEPYENIVTREVSYIWNINPGDNIVKKLLNPEHGVAEVAFEYQTSARETNILIEKLRNRSILVNQTPFGILYGYIDIWVNVPSPKYLQNSSIKFYVDKSWIAENEIDLTKVALFQYINSSWTQLPTEVVYENESIIMYSSPTSGFSHFAIAGMKKENIQKVNFVLDLHKGWNLISIPIYNESLTLQVLNSVSGQKIENILIFNKTFASFEKYNLTLGNYEIPVEPYNGYMVYTKDDAQINIEGTIVERKVIELKKGWNLVNLMGIEKFNSSSVILEFLLTNAKYISIFNESKQEYEMWITNFSLEKDKFTIEQDRVYLIFADSECRLELADLQINISQNKSLL
jgi:PGF-pre-PGF domain-containing protein